jgi:hypothetical protein
MPDPLPSDVVVRLRTDPTAALAAALILASAFPDLISWALRALGGKDGAPTDEMKANGAGRSNGAAASARARGNGGYTPEAVAKNDQALLVLMHRNPGASLARIIALNGRPRTSTVQALERLAKGGLVEHAERGKWIAADPDLLEAPAPRPAGWIAPLSGGHVARHAADGRVRGELTSAGA